MVIDVFPFSNELDILEIRLNILDKFVDKFILIEAKFTHSGVEKELLFEKNKERFKRFLPKIEHIVIDNFDKAYSLDSYELYKLDLGRAAMIKNNPEMWKRENYQREYAKEILKNYPKDAIVLINDVDEIPNLDLADFSTIDKEPVAFESTSYVYYLNGFTGVKMNFTTRAFLNSNIYSPHSQRYLPIKKVIKNGGWHFSSVGALPEILTKYFSVVPHSVNEIVPDHDRAYMFLRHGLGLSDTGFNFELVEIDSTFPKYIQDNQDKYSHIIGKKEKLSVNTDDTEFLRKELIRLRKIYNKTLMENNELKWRDRPGSNR